jgi:hypothetical protein
MIDKISTALACIFFGAIVGLIVIDYIRAMGGARSILTGG